VCLPCLPRLRPLVSQRLVVEGVQHIKRCYAHAYTVMVLKPYTPRSHPPTLILSPLPCLDLHLPFPPLGAARPIYFYHTSGQHLPVLKLNFLMTRGFPLPLFSPVPDIVLILMFVVMPPLLPLTLRSCTSFVVIQIGLKGHFPAVPPVLGGCFFFLGTQRPKEQRKDPQTSL